MVINIEKLTLKNFKGIKNLEIDFKQETNISGDNGTGKTTINDAFTWLLFGKDSKDRKDFEIKTLGLDGEALHGLDHTVEGEFKVDNNQLKLGRTFKEKWTKKKGQADAVFSGHETIYYINDVPTTMKDYNSKVNEYLAEDTFKLISNPLYFNTNLKWQQRREILMSIIGDLDNENVIGFNPNLKALEQLLGREDINTLRQQVKAKIKRLKDGLKAIPYRIDECNNSVTDIDFEAVEFRLRGIKSGLDIVNKKLVEGQQDDANMVVKREIQELEQEAQFINGQLSQLSRSKEQLLRDITYNNSDIEDKKNKQASLREEWQKVKNETFNPQLNTICPTCKRELPVDELEAKTEDLLRNFEENKAKELQKISTQGRNYTSMISQIEAAVKVANERVEEVNEKIKDFDNKLNNLDAEIQAKRGQLVSDPVNDQSNLIEKKYELERELNEVTRLLAKKDNNETLKARIAELEEEERELSCKIAELEGQDFLCEEFIKTKVVLLNDTINKKFNGEVEFKLFDVQINGGVSETCECTVNGIPFSNVNTAGQINAGMSIINVLSEHYRVHCPIWVDNAESINNILPTESQLIRLIVSKDKKLVVE